jgi:hypothetical protein
MKGRNPPPPQKKKRKYGKKEKGKENENKPHLKKIRKYK